MTKARRERLKEARTWFHEQGFTDDSRIVKAYRERFSVDKDCAMRELCLLGVLSPEKQKAYQDQLKVKDQKRAEKKEARAARASVKTDVSDNPFQDENFYFIAGYTPGGAPYGITWEEAGEFEASELETEQQGLDIERFEELPF